MDHSETELGERLIVIVPRGYKATFTFTPDTSYNHSFHESTASSSVSTCGHEYDVPTTPREVNAARVVTGPTAQETPSPRLAIQQQQQQQQQQLQLAPYTPLRTRSFDFSDEELLRIQAAIQASVPYLAVWNGHFKHIQRDAFKYRWKCIVKDLEKLV